MHALNLREKKLDKRGSIAYICYIMNKKRLQQIEKRVKRIQEQLQAIGEMRPGTLTRQYKIPKERIGPYYQISYTHNMKSRTEYVRPQFLNQIREQIRTYKRFRELIKEWTDLAIEHSKLQIELAKKNDPQ